MLYSIIIATKNAEKYLERCLSSLFRQTWPDYEVILQDGLSTDDTLKIAGKYSGRLQCVSEADTGVYDAWNKALDRAAGEWGIFLGADDFLVDGNVLANCRLHLKKLPPEITFAYGNVLHGENGKLSGVWARSLSFMYHYFLTNMGLPFPATFTRLEALKKARFDTSYQIAGDYDLAARLLTKDNAAYLPVHVTWMEKGGLSSRPEQRHAILEERRRVVRTRVVPKAGMLAEASLEYLGY